MLAKFKNPVVVQFEPDDNGNEVSRKADTFLSYVQLMQWPDPTFIQMSNETNNLVVMLVNEGKLDPWQALRIGSQWYFNNDGVLDVHPSRSHYTFDELGREGILFPSVDRMAKLLYEHCESLGGKGIQPKSGPGIYATDYQEHIAAMKQAINSIPEALADMLVTLGTRAGSMEAQDCIELPSGVEGEAEFSKWATQTVRNYLNEEDTRDISYDEFIEHALIKKYGCGSYTAFAYNDEDGTTEDAAKYYELEEAVKFAKSHNWDEVRNDVTGEVVWHR